MRMELQGAVEEEEKKEEEEEEDRYEEEGDNEKEEEEEENGGGGREEDEEEEEEEESLIGRRVFLSFIAQSLQRQDSRSDKRNLALKVRFAPRILFPSLSVAQPLSLRQAFSPLSLPL